MRGVLLGLASALATIACAGNADPAELSRERVPPLREPTSAASPTATVRPFAATPTAVPAASQPPATPSPTPTTVGLPPTETPMPLALRALRVERAFPAISFERMVAMAFPDDGSNRAFLVLQPGRIMVFPNEQTTPAPRSFSTSVPG